MIISEERREQNREAQRRFRESRQQAIHNRLVSMTSVEQRSKALREREMDFETEPKPTSQFYGLSPSLINPKGILPEALLSMPMTIPFVNHSNIYDETINPNLSELTLSPITSSSSDPSMHSRRSSLADTALMACRTGKSPLACPILHLPSAKGHVAIVRKLLDSGASLTSRDLNGRTALHMAAKNSAIEVMQLLCDAGVPIDVEDSDGRAALHLAASNGSEAAVELLLNYGARL